MQGWWLMSRPGLSRMKGSERQSMWGHLSQSRFRGIIRWFIIFKLAWVVVFFLHGNSQSRLVDEGVSLLPFPELSVVTQLFPHHHQIMVMIQTQAKLIVETEIIHYMYISITITVGGLWNKNPDRPLNPDKANNECDTQPDNSEVHCVALLTFYCQEIPINILFQLHMYHILSIL